MSERSTVRHPPDIVRDWYQDNSTFQHNVILHDDKNISGQRLFA